MYTLGIETSCDETSAAVVRERRVLSCVTLTSLKLHKKYGGIIPEIASRQQLKVIEKVVEFALAKAKIKIKDLGLIAVTQGPGLIGSLLVGISFAKALAFSLKLPILGVDHLKAHLFAPFLNKKKMPFPFIGLLASGGHTQLYLVRDFDKMKVIARTRDDAAGEALDKVGRFYGLGFPAGPRIDRLYEPRLVDKDLFKIKKLDGLDFSFSGIKTKAVYLHDNLKKERGLTGLRKKEVLSSFQYGVINSLINNLTQSLKEFKIKRVAAGGGVSANSLLRKELDRMETFAEVLVPELEYCQDNGACIAGLAEYLHKKGYRSSWDFGPCLGGG